MRGGKTLFKNCKQKLLVEKYIFNEVKNMQANHNYTANTYS